MPLTLRYYISSHQLPPETATGGLIKGWFLDNATNRHPLDVIMQHRRGNQGHVTEIYYDTLTLGHHGVNTESDSITVLLHTGVLVSPFFCQPLQHVPGFHVRAELTPPSPPSADLTGADIRAWVLSSFLHRSVDDFALYNSTETIEIDNLQTLEYLNIDPLLGSPFVLRPRFVQSRVMPIPRPIVTFVPGEAGDEVKARCWRAKDDYVRALTIFQNSFRDYAPEACLSQFLTIFEAYSGAYVMALKALIASIAPPQPVLPANNAARERDDANERQNKRLRVTSSLGFRQL